MQKIKNNFFYFTIPLNNENTLLYTYFKKYLIKIPKNKLDEIISKFLSDQKYDKEYRPITEILNLLLKEERALKKYLQKKFSYGVQQKRLNDFIFHRNKLQIIIGENIILPESINHIIPFKKITNRILHDDNKKLIIGLIYDRRIINFLYKNKKLLENSFCCLVGINEIYILRLSNSFCAKCLWVRRSANRKNLLETILLEDYLQRNKIKYLLKDEQLNFIIYYINHRDLKENILIKNVITQEESFHGKIIPFAFCPLCKNDKVYQKSSKYKIIDNKTGIINSINTNKIELNKTKFYISTTKISNIIPISRLRLFNKFSIDKISKIIIRKEIYTDFSPWRHLVCGSVSTNKKISEIKAISESIERYCASLYSKKYFLFRSYEKIKSKAIPPTKWILFNTNQYRNPVFPYEPFTNNLKIFWTLGVNLKTKNKIYLPASLVFIRYFFDKKEGKIGTYPTTGLTCGNNKKEILLSGICENIERDACMLGWFLKIPPKKIVNVNDKKIQNILKNFKINGIDLNLFEISLDIRVPTVLALGINKNKTGPKIFIGSACKPKLKDAILRAIDELSQGFNWHLLERRYRNYNFGKGFKNITHFEHRALFYSQLSDLSILKPILKTKRILDYRNFQSKMITFNEIVDSLCKLGYNVFYTDLTTPEVKNCLDLKVYKILIPGLQPLNSNHNTPFFDPKRIKRIINYLNLKKIKYTKNINLTPHPFT